MFFVHDKLAWQAGIIILPRLEDEGYFVAQTGIPISSAGLIAYKIIEYRSKLSSVYRRLD